MISGAGLSLSYGPTRALRGVDIQAEEGETLAVFGPNGAGKSTLLAAIAGERRLDAGRIFFRGAEARRSRTDWRRRLGVLTHRAGLYLGMTARENLLFFARLKGVARPEAEIRRRSGELGLGDVLDRPARVLSRGQRQRTALARALLGDPDLLLLDEPFSGLDAAGRKALRGAMKQSGSQGRTTIFVTHEIRAGLELSDCFLLLQRGRALCRGRATQAAEEEIAALYGDGE